MTNRPLTTLTARKRAGHFLNHLKGFEFFGDSDGLEKDIDALTSEIEQAQREAFLGIQSHVQSVTNARLEGYSSGYKAGAEAAAKVAETFEPDNCTRAYAEGYLDAIGDVSGAIRALSLPSATVPGEGKDLK